MVPKASMKVLLPTPGTPVTPTRCAPPAWGSTAWRTACARAWCSGLALSTSVMARESNVRSPARMPAASAAGSGALTPSEVAEAGELPHRAQRRVEDAQPEPVLALVGDRLVLDPGLGDLEVAPAVVARLVAEAALKHEDQLPSGVPVTRERPAGVDADQARAVAGLAQVEVDRTRVRQRA